MFETGPVVPPPPNFWTLTVSIFSTLFPRDPKEMLIKVSLIGQNQLIVLGNHAICDEHFLKRGANLSVNRNNVYAPQRPLTILRKTLHDSTSRWRLLIIITNVDIDFYFFDIISPKERKCAFSWTFESLSLKGVVATLS